jgi:hypothetical protein
MQTITLESLEQLAAQIIDDDDAERNRLLRLVRAYAQIIGRREPGEFARMATRRVSDDDGDNSYPPETKYVGRSGPVLLRLADPADEEVRTSGGFYHSWKIQTTDSGLYVDRIGNLYGRYQTGTGHYGQFAAHPGDCDVEIEIDWERLDEGEIAIDRLRDAEEILRGLASPLVADEAG